MSKQGASSPRHLLCDQLYLSVTLGASRMARSLRRLSKSRQYPELKPTIAYYRASILKVSHITRSSNTVTSDLWSVVMFWMLALVRSTVYGVVIEEHVQVRRLI